MQIQINRETIQVGSRGAVVTLDLTKLSPAIMEQLFIYGVTQKLSDAASTAGTEAAKAALGEEANKAARQAYLETPAGQEAAKARAETMMQKAADTLYSGEWSLREGSGQRIMLTDAQALAVEKAKADLTERFKKVCVAKGIKGTIANFASLGEVVAKYFSEKGGKFTWLDSAVISYIEAQAEAENGRDYMAEAQAELDARAKQVADIDVSDLLAGL